MSEKSTAFEPARHLSLVNGNEYLEVKWRLVWLRSDYPDAVIETHMASHQNGEAIFKAKVSTGDGGSATGWGSEDSQSFGDYIEKAETKAIGRALAALGYGTQFCADHDFGSGQGRVVDSPVGNNRQGYQQQQGPAPRPMTGGITDPQKGKLKSLVRARGMAEDEVAIMLEQHNARSYDELTKQAASTLINSLL
jgi:hypothetical protein